MNPMMTYWAKLYSNPTPAESAIEPAIAALGIPYRFQHPFFGHHIIADFILPTIKVILEVDDPSHNTTKKRKADAEKTAKLAARGWTTVRCTNEEAMLDPYAIVEARIAPLLKGK